MTPDESTRQNILDQAFSVLNHARAASAIKQRSTPSSTLVFKVISPASRCSTKCRNEARESPPMKGDARAMKEASPTPTNIRQITRLQKFQVRPQPATARVQMESPREIRRKAFLYLLASANNGEVMSMPTMKALGRMPTSTRERTKSPCIRNGG